MPIAFQCECGRPFYLKDEYAARAIHCPNCRKPITVPLLTPLTAITAGVQTLAATSDQGPQRPGGGRDTVSADNNYPSIKHRFNLTDLALAVGITMMIAAVLWYFIGHRWLGGDRYAPAMGLFVAGVGFMFKYIIEDMDGPRD